MFLEAWIPPSYKQQATEMVADVERLQLSLLFLYHGGKTFISCLLLRKGCIISTYN